MTPDNEICHCESCESLRKNHSLDPYFSSSEEFDSVQEGILFPDLDFDGDILDLY